MTNIRFLANMNISPNTVEALRKHGWDIVRVSQFLPVNAFDQDILEFARKEDRVVVTEVRQKTGDRGQKTGDRWVISFRA